MEPEKNEAGQPSSDKVHIGSKPFRLIGLCAFISLFVVILYFNSLGNQFTNWDDAMIYANPQIRSLAWDNIAKVFSFGKGATYQPIRTLSYGIDYYFWKLRPVGYHITNILFLHCIMVFFTLHHLSSGLRMALLPFS
jgi:hypothetical protein